MTLRYKGLFANLNQYDAGLVAANLPGAAIIAEALLFHGPALVLFPLSRVFGMAGHRAALKVHQLLEGPLQRRDVPQRTGNAIVQSFQAAAYGLIVGIPLAGGLYIPYLPSFGDNGPAIEKPQLPQMPRIGAPPAP